MAKNLVIVESPAKAKTIQGYLGADYKVIATIGHLIDLPKSKLGVDVENGYEIDYVAIKDKDKVISGIQNEVKKTTGMVYLAQDPDREGEAIAWQVAHLTNTEKLEGKKIIRAVFHEITKQAVNEAIKNTRKIDIDLVEAQRGRRVLDRLVGYPLSQLLWKKIQYGLSAGRVQSVALRIIVEREDEIKAFIPTPYVQISAKYEGIDIPFAAVDKKGGIAKLDVEIAKKLLDNLDKKGIHTVIDRKVKQITLSPTPPLTTSTMQQAANRLFGFSAKMTMRTAQELYQGVDIKEKGGLTGLITYMRTDSVALSQQFITSARAYIKKEYGEKFLNPTERRFKTKSKVAQEAHEAIRPSHVEIAPNDIKDYLTPQQFRLYSLIWRRAVATQMTPRLAEKEDIKILPKTGEAKTIMEKENLMFSVSAERELFAGFSLLAPVNMSNVKPLPKIEKGDEVTVKEILSEQLMTTPRGRYNDASLIREMERLGIGRPSTYASIIGTLLARNYVERDQKTLFPTSIGIVVCNFLKQYFSKIVDFEFTAKMEKELDEIANAKMNKKTMLDNFYPKFIKEVEEKQSIIKKEELTVLEETDKPCRKCGKNMVLKIGPYGKYYACKDSTCKTSEPYLDTEKYFVPPEVESEGFILKQSRFGKFWAHKDYPEVKKTLRLLLKEVCPDCGSHLVERKGKTGRTFIGCSNYPNCKYLKGKFFSKKTSKVESSGESSEAKVSLKKLLKPKVKKSKKSTAKNAKAKTKRTK